MDDLRKSTPSLSSSLSSVSSSSEKLSWNELLEQNIEIYYSDNRLFETNIKILEELKRKIIIFETQDECDTLDKPNHFVRPYIIFVSTLDQFIVLNKDPEISKLGLIYIKLSDQYLNFNTHTLDTITYTSDNYPKINIIKNQKNTSGSVKNTNYFNN